MQLVAEAESAVGIEGAVVSRGSVVDDVVVVVVVIVLLVDVVATRQRAVRTAKAILGDDSLLA